MQSRSDNTTITSYVNSNETVTNTIDKGYATVQQTCDANGQLTEEYFFNADGSQTVLSKGQYGIKRIEKVKLLLNKKRHYSVCG